MQTKTVYALTLTDGVYWIDRGDNDNLATSTEISDASLFSRLSEAEKKFEELSDDGYDMDEIVEIVLVYSDRFL